MTHQEWRPMGQSPAQAGALHDGVPPWMEESLWRWLSRALAHRQDGTTYFHTGFVLEYQRRSRSLEPISEWLTEYGVEGLRLRMSGPEALQLVDFCVSRASEFNFVPSLVELERVLSESGSAWRVGTRDGFPGLERRVAEGVQEAAEEAMATPGHAGRRLSEAWHAVYGVNPDPTKAYAFAVRAVEDATIPTVTSANNATLGTVIRQLESDGDWSLPLTREDSTAPTAQTIIHMTKALWKGHHDRHGGVPTAAATVNQDEAEAAVHLAVFLVHGFASGLIARR